MNEYQKHNVMLQEGLPTSILTDLRDGTWARMSFQTHMRCVDCGNKKITLPIMKFFDFNPKKYLCYDCQTKNKYK